MIINKPAKNFGKTEKLKETILQIPKKTNLERITKTIETKSRDVVTVIFCHHCNYEYQIRVLLPIDEHNEWWPAEAVQFCPFCGKEKE